MESKGWKQLKSQGKMREFLESSPVMVHTPEKWTPGKVTSILGNMHYQVQSDGKSVKRHIDQFVPLYGDSSNVSMKVAQEPVPNSAPPAQSGVPTPIDENVHEPNIPTEVPPTPYCRKELPLRTRRGLPPTRLDL